MINTQILRDNKGGLHLHHAGTEVDGALVVDLAFNGADGKMYAKVLIPMNLLELGEVVKDNVLPFVRPAEK